MISKTLTSESLPSSFAIRDVEIWNARGLTPRSDVFVEQGRVVRIVPTGSMPLPQKTFEGKGRVLMPSGVDNQVHLRVPGQPQKELPENGLRAALRGGVGAVLTMPNTKPVIDRPEIVEEARALVAPAEQATGVRVLFSGAMTLGQEGLQPVNAGMLARAGVHALTDDGKGVAREDVMRAVFAANAGVGLPLLQHAEVPGHGGVLAPGPVQDKCGVRPYSDEAEWKMVERDLALLAEFPEQRYHVLHISAAKTVELIAAAKAKGLHATGETSPHHLLFTVEDIKESDTSFKMNPPLRHHDDRTVLRAALGDGRLDFVATDHAPHEVAAKGTAFAESAFGTTGLEALLRVLLLLEREGTLTPQRLVEVFSTAPARFLGIDAEFGEIIEGKPLRAILVDAKAPARPLVLEELESLNKNSCFLGSWLPGHVHMHFNGAGVFEF